MNATATPRPAPIPSVEWELTTRCNYDCSYCTQRSYAGLHWGDCSDATVDAMLSLLRQQSSSWSVKLSGGEPFVHPRFLKIVGQVAGMSHRVSTTTNFSVPQRVLGDFLEAAGGQLDFLTASLHLEQLRDVPEFVAKAKWFQSAKPTGARFVVTTVGIESELPQLRSLADQFEEAGIVFEVAPRKEGAHYVAYADPEFVRFMDQHALTHVQEIRGANMMGTVCHAGHQFVRVTVDGDALRCYNYQPRFALGNVTDGSFRWLDGPKPCLARQCTCTVPANRNMIEYGNRVGAGAVAADGMKALVQHGPAWAKLGTRWAGKAIRGVRSSRR